MDLEKEIAMWRRELEVAKAACDMRAVLSYEYKINFLENMLKNKPPENKPDYPQSAEDNEYRYIDADWLDNIAAGLTQGVKNHPGETWRSIPADEHAARAMRHLNLFRAGDESDDHLINASMRIMMAYVVDRSNTTQTKSE